MKKYNKSDYINIFIVIMFFLLFLVIILLSSKGSLYISKLDYVDQHYLIPEYFRTLFYETKQLLPSFALNLGMGQNIFNFSYYGLLSPIVLISYLLPFVKMIDYMVVVSILTIIVDIFLFYKWISGYTEDKKIRLLITSLFLMASPILLHSHRHIMFVSYIPFLLLGLIGVDNYFLKGKKILLMISILLIIMTSYFFSIPSLISLVVYGVFVYIRINSKITFKQFMKDGLVYCLYFIIPVLMSCVLLFPTFGAILSNRLDTSVSISLAQLLVPNFNLNTILYGSYALGLTSIAIVAICYSILLNKKEYKFLSVVFLLIVFFPFINYLLNGMMYINSKVFIPFIPLVMLLVVNFVKDLFDKKVDFKKLLIIFVFISIIGCIKFGNRLFYIGDALLVFIAIYLYYKKNMKRLFIAILIFISFITTLAINLSDELIPRDVKHEQYNEDINKLFFNVSNNSLKRTMVLDIDALHDSNDIRNINEYKTTMYSSLTNKYYNNFYFNEFNNNNPYRNSTIISGTDNVLYNIYTGTQNYIAKEDKMIGYYKVASNNEYNLYKNDDVFDVVYANDKLMSLSDYRKLEYPYNVEALMNYTIVDKNVSSSFSSSIKEIPFDESKLNAFLVDGKYKFTLDDNKKIDIKLDQEYKNKLIFIEFDMEYSQSCSVGDTYIIINGVKNTLTCSSWKYHNKNYTFNYVLSSPYTVDSLNLEFSKGEYVIDNIKLYYLDYDSVKGINNNHDNINITSINSDFIHGNINVSNDSYLNIMFPYDKGFMIYVDGKKQDYELINTSFIGFNITKGYHDISIKYQSPLLSEGKIISFIGVLLFVSVIIVDKKKGSKK